MDSLTITKPDDWHIHLRDDKQLKRTVADCAAQFARAIVMPNLTPPVTTAIAARDYRERILHARPKGSFFEPLMTLYITDETTAEIIQDAKDAFYVHALKLYPSGVTTNSAAGVTEINKLFPVFAAMEKHGLPLLIHGEVNDPNADIFDRERLFIDKHLNGLVQQFPELKIVMEHITTEEAVDFIISAPANVAATITAHHLLLDRNDLLSGGIKPHHYCLPILKREQDRKALIRAATMGTTKFFLGSDSAPHAVGSKESACGCAGIYTGHNTLALYAEIFDSVNALDKLEGFASFYGADFYGLGRNKETITLTRKKTSVNKSLAFGDTELIPFRAGESVAWTVKADE